RREEPTPAAEESLGMGEAGVDLSSIPDTIPLLPLRDAVLFPNAVVPLAFADEPLITAVDEAMRSHRMVGVVMIRAPKGPAEPVERPLITRQDLHDVGTVAVIHRLVKHPQAGMRLLVQGVSRFRIVRLHRNEPYPEASILVVPESSGDHSDRVEALLREGHELAGQVIAESSYLPDELRQAIRQLTDPGQFAYMVASMVRLDSPRRQKVLETDDLEEKLDVVLRGLRRELNVLQIGGEIKSQVDEEIQDRQREYYLREQLKAIKAELGEEGDEGTEIKRLRDCLIEAAAPETVMKAAEEQFQRLSNIPSASPEYSIILGYLDWLCQVPWTRSSQDRLDLEHARRVLDEDHYDLSEVKDRILEYLAVRKLKPGLKGPILCFVGPPGVGKTSLGRSIACALGREFVRMSLGGMRDEAEIRGHRRTYIGAMPGRIVQSLKQAGTNNPVFMLDEIDKVGIDFRGDPSSALLEVLDPEQNDTFRDHYLDLPVDLSKVLFIATANMLDTIQPALQDRMEIIRLAGYIDREKLHIAVRYLVPKQLAENGLDESRLAFTDAALERIIADYTREAGVRSLEREIAKVSRKVAARVAAKADAKRIEVGAEDLAGYLGPRKAYREMAHRVAQPGVATALAWTPAGGEILFVEATTMPGGKGFTVTGKLGDVMQESARAALGYVRSHAADLGIEGDFFKDMDIHLHVPAGAIPKDGPSAGVTMATAIASAVTGRRVRPDVAMTGEITLTGLVLPVGGIKEKLVSARRSEIRTVILPERNREHVADVDPELLDGLEFIYAETIGQVLQAALMDGVPQGSDAGH
ncbi:MAG TPA: endopeptidase La, partial [Gemmatimonadota bacterium]|nr:endopeptidase La [Gemmatimonadota bacterium]